MQPSTSTNQTENGRGQNTCIPSQTRSSESMFMEFVHCLAQIHKLDEDFTPSLGNVTLTIPQDEVEEEEDSDRGEDREGRTELTADSLSDLLVGYRSKR